MINPLSKEICSCCGLLALFEVNYYWSCRWKYDEQNSDNTDDEIESGLNIDLIQGWIDLSGKDIRDLCQGNVLKIKTSIFYWKIVIFIFVIITEGMLNLAPNEIQYFSGFE